MQHSIQKLKSLAQIGPRMLRLEKQDVADEPQRMPRSFARRHKLLDAIAARHQTDLVIAGNRAKREQRGQFRGHLSLLLSLRAELQAAAAIDHEHHRQVAFLNEALDKRM